MSETGYSSNSIDPYKTTIVAKKKVPKRSFNRQPSATGELFNLDLFSRKKE